MNNRFEINEIVEPVQKKTRKYIIFNEPPPPTEPVSTELAQAPEIAQLAQPLELPKKNSSFALLFHDFPNNIQPQIIQADSVIQILEPTQMQHVPDILNNPTKIIKKLTKEEKEERAKRREILRQKWHEEKRQRNKPKKAAYRQMRNAKLKQEMEALRESNFDEYTIKMKELIKKRKKHNGDTRVNYWKKQCIRWGLNIEDFPEFNNNPKETDNKEIVNTILPEINQPVESEFNKKNNYKNNMAKFFYKGPIVENNSDPIDKSASTVTKQFTK